MNNLFVFAAERARLSLFRGKHEMVKTDESKREVNNPETDHEIADAVIGNDGYGTNVLL